MLTVVLLLVAGMLWLAPGSALASDSSVQGPEPLSFCYRGRLPETRVLVVDKSRQRLMILRYEGTLAVEYEFPCATGANSGRKEKEGDERTPEGIYFTTHRYTDSKITIFGDRAIHLNYPNPFDQAEGLKGNGIYIHGTNQSLKPRSSNGCITLKNPDLAALAELIKEQLTPVVVVDEFSLANKEQRARACGLLEKLRGLSQARTEAGMAPALALLTARNGSDKPPSDLALRLEGLYDSASKLKIKTRGQVLLGLGRRWVLLVEQQVWGVAKEPLKMVRHFYLTLEKNDGPNLVMGQWVLPDLATARHLASLIPPLRKPLPQAAARKKAGPTPRRPLDSKTQVARTVNLWLKAWQKKDLRNYIRHYAKDFRNNGMNRSKWRRHKAYLNRVYNVIRVEARNLNVKVTGEKAWVDFVQYYRSDWHRDLGRKKLIMVRREGRWRIYRETWNKIKSRANSRGDDNRL